MRATIQIREIEWHAGAPCPTESSILNASSLNVEQIELDVMLTTAAPTTTIITVPELKFNHLSFWPGKVESLQSVLLYSVAVKINMCGRRTRSCPIVPCQLSARNAPPGPDHDHIIRWAILTHSLTHYLRRRCCLFRFQSVLFCKFFGCCCWCV